MEVIYHPLVRRDVEEACRYYHQISARLADGFRDELRHIICRVTETPLRYSATAERLRRANLRQFPYHVLYDTAAEHIRILLVRHNKRHPQHGLERM